MTFDTQGANVDRRVLVTGADGFIGSHVVEGLVQSGRTVRAMCQYNSFSSHGWLDSSPVLTDVETVLGDVRDADSTVDAARGCTDIIHLAALIAIPYSYRAPQAYVETNVAGTVNLLRAASQADARRFVHASTSEVYGTPESIPIRETHALRAQSPYAASKIGADMMAEAWARSFDLDVVIVRPFNTFGPRQSMRAVIPTILTQLLESSTVQLGDLRPKRDFTYVTDTAGGFIAALDAMCPFPTTVQLGTGRSVSIGDLVKICCDVVGVERALMLDEQRLRPADSEVQILESDPSFAAEVLGWSPTVTLEQGLRWTIEFLRHRSIPADVSKYHV